MPIETAKYNGYVVYCNSKKPLGVVSIDGERMAICNMPILPKKFKRYLIDIEDKRFYQHVGIDIKGIIRAMFENLKVGKVVQGGSTITQQLARNILRDNRKSIIRKLKELFIAFQLENQYVKDKILELYFNKVFWGKRIYGLRAASLEYFSKEPEHLNTAEQLALLTFLRGPNYYLKNEEKFLKRYDLLSHTLYKHGIISSKKIPKSRKQTFRFAVTILRFSDMIVCLILQRRSTKIIIQLLLLSIKIYSEKPRDSLQVVSTRPVLSVLLKNRL